MALEPAGAVQTAEGSSARSAGSGRERYPGFGASGAEALDDFLARTVAESGEPFDWGRADDPTLCAAIEAHAAELVLGVEGDVAERGHALDALVRELGRTAAVAPRISARNDRLGTVHVSLDRCAGLGAIRTLPGIAFVEVQVATASDRSIGALDPRRLATAPVALEAQRLNPGLYDPAGGEYRSYADYLAHVDPNDSVRMRRQHVEPVYDELGAFGGPDVGVAVIDNGVVPEWVEFLATGRGTYRALGFHPPDVGNPHPKDTDAFGLAAFDHGTNQSRHVQSFAPHADRVTARASVIPEIVFPNDFAGVTDAIVAMADDDRVRVVSMSLGTIFRSQELERAIDELVVRDKILIAAAGTTAPVIRDLLGVVYPALLPEVVSTTGLSDTTETGGAFELGATSHGGPENDFVIEPSPASSESVSTMAGIVATLWSLGPDQPRESILDALIRSSSFFRETGAKDAVFGWGRIDAYEAALTIQQGGCRVR